MAATADESEGWDGALGRKWLHALDMQEQVLAPIGMRLLQAAAIGRAERVLEIGPGGGWLARQMAALVGPEGLVVGLDISPALRAEAARRARDLPQCRFELGDAATATPDGAPFDRLVSRFGVMFFADPAAGFRHLASLLKPGAPLHFAAWADPRRNLWVMDVRRIIARFVELPTQDPRAPGQFQLADPAFLDAALAGAGLVDCRRQLVEGPMWLGGKGVSAEQVADGMMQSMAYGELLAPLAADVRAEIRARLSELFARHLSADGAAMQAAWWLVSARAPG